MNIYICEKNLVILDKIVKCIGNLRSEGEEPLHIIVASTNPYHMVKDFLNNRVISKGVYIINHQFNDAIYHLGETIRQVDPLGYMIVLCNEQMQVEELFENKLGVLDYIHTQSKQIVERKIVENINYIREHESLK